MVERQLESKKASKSILHKGNLFYWLAGFALTSSTLPTRGNLVVGCRVIDKDWGEDEYRGGACCDYDDRNYFLVRLGD
jgi:hypothetical protein